MRLLLDTCAFLWWTTNPERLSPRATQALRHPDNEIFFSVVTAWEIAIKYRIGRLELPRPPQRYISDWLKSYNLQPIEIGLPHVLGAGALPLHHSDPFDRLLIAQAQIEGLAIVTTDTVFSGYAVDLLW